MSAKLTEFETIMKAISWLQQSGHDGQVVAANYQGRKAVVQRIVSGKIEVQLPLPFRVDGDQDDDSNS